MDSKHVVLLLDESNLKSNDRFNLRISLHRRWNKFSRLQKQTILFLFLSTFVIILFLSSLKNPPNSDSFNEFKDPKLVEDYGASDKIFFDDYLTVVHNLEKNAKKTQFTSKQKEVIDAFKFAWSNYKKYAWGHDILKPNSMLFRDDYHLGLSIVDGIDTMFMMDLKEDYVSARDWIKNHLIFDYNKPVSVFEVTIRVLGGLLAIYHMTGDKVFLEKAQQLGDKLSFAFHTKSKVPYSDVNFHSNISQSPFWVKYSSTAEIGTLQLEFRDLSRSSNIPKYEELAANVSSHIHGLNKTDGLVPIFIAPNTGNFHPSTITMGARADSYYEYLLKQWLQTGKTDDNLKNDYIEAIDGAEKHLMKRTYKNNLLFIGELFSNNEFSPKMDHLACFLPGTLILGARNGLPKNHETLAQDLIQTCYKMYEINANFLSGEIAYFHTSEPSLQQDDIYFKKNDNYNLLRPEFIESLYYMYYFTGNRTYQDWGYKIFHAFMNYTKVENGFKGIRNDIDHDSSNLHDEMDSYFLSETLKYFFLLFADKPSEQIDLQKFVFNTEGHPLPIYAH